MVDLLDGTLCLSAAGERTLLQQLMGQLRALIETGRLMPGQRLPSSRQMAESLDVSRNTVSAAIEQLVAEGYLVSFPGRRPVVATAPALVGIAARSKPDARRADRPKLSKWARGLNHSVWPPVYESRPRPFQPGLADSREFPHEAWGRCLRRAARQARLRGNRSHNDGLNVAALQEALLRHLAEHRGIAARPEQIIIVPSAQAGIALIARIMIDPGDLAWVESPGYGGAVVALQAAGATIVGMSKGTIGRGAGTRSGSPKLIFVTPSHQYPTARLMPFAERIELLGYARRVGASIIEDDYDGEFQYDGRPVASLQGVAPFPRVFYLGTFAKSMFADIRVGYVVVPENLAGVFALAQRHTGAMASITIQDALAEFMTSGSYLAHIRRMARVYERRRDRMVRSLVAATEGRFPIETPPGGMQLLVRCPPASNDRDLTAQLLEAGVVARPLSSMLFHRSEDQGLFLGFAAWNELEIDRAARIVGRILVGAPHGPLVRSPHRSNPVRS
ncbi:PLP-dependent aminotransferase family protein [Reyranella sp.]|uniref:MocR-like pyridoxine biosynthesis transcription factor PdxR n=1 Tax=Reyranella sp. TaxID=1929291 RepID=UPI003D0F0EA8